MKYLHIMRNDKFINPFIEFINKNFLKEENAFFIIDGLETIEVPNEKNVERYISKGKNLKGILKKVVLLLQLPILYIKLFNYSKKCEKIYFHGLFDPRIIVFIYFFRFFLKKSSWIIWGGDLYDCVYKKNSFIQKSFEKIDRYVKKNMAVISTLVPEDYLIAKKYYDVSGEYQRAIYINPIKLEFLEKISKASKNGKKFINIQIGNSADPANNHFEVLDILKKYKDENIKIYCPLSYGDREYALKVTKYGKKIFKEKFVEMLNFLNPQKYTEYLGSIDILIFNHKRQQGLANINALAYLEKKIYIRSDISSWNYLKNEIGLKIFDIEEIKKKKFSDFINNPKNNNKEIILNTVYSNEYQKKIWQKNFLVK